MINRFSTDKRLLRGGILEQQCIAHDEEVTDAICKALELVSIPKGKTLITQGETGNDLYLILAGRVSVRVNGREVAIRQAHQHIGEMSVIDTSAPRSASVVALEDTVVAKVPEAAFAAIAESHPWLWRRLALELGARLRERSKLINAPNPRPVIFIGSSVEGLRIAEEIQLGLSHDDVVPQVWKDNVFQPSQGTMEALESRIMTADFGVLVCTKDDHITNEARGVDSYAPRDNVVLELGMCLGALGRKRIAIVKPRARDIKIPTDLLGITLIDYTADDADNVTAHLGSVCSQIRKMIQKLGPR